MSSKELFLSLSTVIQARFLRCVFQVGIHIHIWTSIAVALLHKLKTSTDVHSEYIQHESRDQTASILFWTSGLKHKDLIFRCWWRLFQFKSLFKILLFIKPLRVKSKPKTRYPFCFKGEDKVDPALLKNYYLFLIKPINSLACWLGSHCLMLSTGTSEFGNKLKFPGPRLAEGKCIWRFWVWVPWGGEMPVKLFRARRFMEPCNSRLPHDSFVCLPG